MPLALVVPGRRLRVRVAPDGRPADGEPTGLAVALPGYPGAVAWLERSAGSPSQAELDRVVVDRLATTARIALDRTDAPRADGDPAAVELLVDPRAAEPARLAAARRLGLADGRRYAVTVSSGDPRPPGSARLGDVGVTVTPGGGPAGTRSAVGPAVPPRELPEFHAQARLAFRPTADGEPGPSHVDCADLGGRSLGDNRPGASPVATRRGR